MKLQPIQNLTKLEQLEPLSGYKPITTNKVSVMKTPSQMELISLSSNLLYKSKLILDNEIKPKNGKDAMSYTYQAINIMKIFDDYENKFITKKEFNRIKKEFGIKKSF